MIFGLREGVEDRRICAIELFLLRNEICFLQHYVYAKRGHAKMEVANDCIPFYPNLPNKTLALRITSQPSSVHHLKYIILPSSLPKYTLTSPHSTRISISSHMPDPYLANAQINPLRYVIDVPCLSCQRNIKASYQIHNAFIRAMSKENSMPK
jgi:hypothetical protein